MVWFMYNFSKETCTIHNIEYKTIHKSFGTQFRHVTHSENKNKFHQTFVRSYVELGERARATLDKRFILKLQAHWKCLCALCTQSHKHTYPYIDTHAYHQPMMTWNKTKQQQRKYMVASIPMPSDLRCFDFECQNELKQVCPINWIKLNAELLHSHL